MSNEIMLENYKGLWVYEGPNDYGFDELNLNIGSTRITLIKLIDGQQLDILEFSPSGSFRDGSLVFNGIPNTNGMREMPLAIFDVSDSEMTCGQIKSAIISVHNVLWIVNLKRQFIS